MKKIIFSLLVGSVLFSSCKKDDAPTCETSVAGIAATYKLTKIELVATGGGTSDVSSVYLTDDCLRNAIYLLKPDRNLVYTEVSSSCTGSDTGNWNVADNKLTITGTPFDFTSAPIDSWDCTTLKIKRTESLGSLVFSFTKQ